MTSASFAEIKAAILKLCYDNKKCVMEVEKKADEIDANIKKASGKARHK